MGDILLLDTLQVDHQAALVILKVVALELILEVLAHLVTQTTLRALPPMDQTALQLPIQEATIHQTIIQTIQFHHLSQKVLRILNILLQVVKLDLPTVHTQEVQVQRLTAALLIVIQTTVERDASSAALEGALFAATATLCRTEDATWTETTLRATIGLRVAGSARS